MFLVQYYKVLFRFSVSETALIKITNHLLFTADAGDKSVLIIFYQLSIRHS